MEISQKGYEAIKKIMYDYSGVWLKETKKPLIVARLRKRIEELRLDGFENYANYVSTHKAEKEYFLNALTTNETFMFRHKIQFDIMQQELLPEIVKKKSHIEPVRILSAACSTGEEPYTLALVCEDYLSRNAGFKYTINAYDINSDVLESARNAVYNERSVSKVPPLLVKKYFQEVETGERYRRKQFKLSRSVADKVIFKRHNLLDVFRGPMADIVFLRNVMIYFNVESKQKVVNNLQQIVKPGGYLVVSLSETLNDVKSKFEFVKSGIYVKKSNYNR